MSGVSRAKRLLHGAAKLSVLLVLVVALGSTGIFVPSLAEASSRTQSDTCTMPYESISVPLTELGQQTYVRMDGADTGFQGGLYPGGTNERPPSNESDGVAIARTIQPLDSEGVPDPTNGRIGMISIGMSNTGQEFGAFQKLLHKNPKINPRLVTVNGGVGGRTADYWVDPSSDAWQELDRRLARASISDKQVQVVWINLVFTKGGDFPAKALRLQTALGDILRLLKVRFPNLKLAYLSSRARSYTYWRGLSPEPVAFETGFAVKWLIEKQIQGAPELNFDPSKGEVLVPFLSWGPYFWVNGPEPRADGFSWGREDLTGDCTHPSLQGRAKIGDLLLTFFLNDNTAQPWFKYGSQPKVMTATPRPPTSVPSPSSSPPATDNQPTISPTSGTMPTPASSQVPQSSPTRAPVAAPISYGVIGALLIAASYWVIRRRNTPR